MASPYICHNPTLIRKDKLAKDVFIKGDDTFTHFSTISQAQTSACIKILICTQAFTSTPNLPSIYTKVNLQKITKLTFELFVKSQEHGKANSAP